MYAITVKTETSTKNIHTCKRAAHNRKLNTNIRNFKMSERENGENVRNEKRLCVSVCVWLKLFGGLTETKENYFILVS